MYATSYLLTRQVSQDDLISVMSVLRMALTLLCSEKFENNKFCWIMKTTKRWHWFMDNVTCRLHCHCLTSLFGNFLFKFQKFRWFLEELETINWNIKLFISDSILRELPNKKGCSQNLKYNHHKPDWHFKHNTIIVCFENFSLQLYYFWFFISHLSCLGSQRVQTLNYHGNSGLEQDENCNNDLNNELAGV